MFSCFRVIFQKKSSCKSLFRFKILNSPEGIGDSIYLQMKFNIYSIGILVDSLFGSTNVEILKFKFILSIFLPSEVA